MYDDGVVIHRRIVIVPSENITSACGIGREAGAAKTTIVLLQQVDCRLCEDVHNLGYDVIFGIRKYDALDVVNHARKVFCIHGQNLVELIVCLIVYLIHIANTLVDLAQGIDCSLPFCRPGYITFF